MFGKRDIKIENEDKKEMTLFTDKYLTNK